MAFWKIKFDKRKINLFKDMCMFMLTESVNKSFLLTLSLKRVLWQWQQRVTLMKESLSGFPFEYNSRPFEESSWTLVEEGKEFVGMYRLLLYWLSGLSSSVSSFVCKLVSCVYGSLTLCYLYPTGGSKSRPKILARRHLLTNQICILLFYFRA